MKYAVALFTILAFTALFAMITPMDIAVAQSSNAMPDGEYKDGDREGKSCPNKEKKEASTSTTLLI